MPNALPLRLDTVALRSANPTRVQEEALLLVGLCDGLGFSLCSGEIFLILAIELAALKSKPSCSDDLLRSPALPSQVTDPQPAIIPGLPMPQVVGHVLGDLDHPP